MVIPQDGADDAANINAALGYNQAVQLLPNAVYNLNTPVNIDNQQGLFSTPPSGSWGYPEGNYGEGSGLPYTGAVLQPTSAFLGAAVISLEKSVAGQFQAGNMYLSNFAINGSELPATAVHGLLASSAAGVTLQNILIGSMTADGIHAIASPPENIPPDFWLMFRVKCSGVGNWGCNVSGLADTWIMASEFTGNGSGGAQIVNGNNTRWIGVRSASNSTGPGWSITGLTGFTGTEMWFGCSSEQNSIGYQVAGNGTGFFGLFQCTNPLNTTPWAYSGTNNVYSDAAFNTSTAAPTFLL
jgi:hypothetical protein